MSRPIPVAENVICLRVRIIKGWDQEGRMGTVFGDSVMLGQLWTPVLWDDEEDPDWFKHSGLELVGNGA